MDSRQEEICQQKKVLRKMVLARRDSMREQDRENASMLMTDRLLGHQWFYQAENILCFLNFGSEISTRELIEEAFRKGKKVFVPKITGDEMQFFQIRSFDTLKKGYLGILEPEDTTKQYLSYSSLDNIQSNEKTLMLMPGVAFDPMRHRLGYGKGFYDKYLNRYPQLQLHTIAVGFACQMVEEIPQEKGDICPCQVILVP